MKTPTTSRRVINRLTRDQYSRLLLSVFQNKDEWAARLTENQTKTAADFAAEHGIHTKQAYGIFAEAGVYTPRVNKRRDPSQPELALSNTPIDRYNEVIGRLSRIEAAVDAIVKALDITV